DLYDGYEAGAEIRRGAAPLLTPVMPSKLVCIGLNYKDHAAEQNKPLPTEPLLFIKPSTAVIGPGESIVVPAGIGRVDHEAELGVVIGRRAPHDSEVDVRHDISSFLFFNDHSARRLQQNKLQYMQLKG